MRGTALGEPRRVRRRLAAVKQARRSTAIIALGTLAFALAACGGASASTAPSTEPTLRPTPTPIAVPVLTPADAAALVIAADPRFAGAIERTPDVIGASKWWTATPLEGGGYRIELTMGWGDCPAGCINRHTWTFEVSPDGRLTAKGETGDPIPVPLPE